MGFLEKYTTGVGIDISEHHVRFAQVSLFGSINETLEIELPDGLIVDGRVEDLKKVQDIVGKKFAKSKLKGANLNAVLLLPESRVFSNSFILPRALRGNNVLVESQKIAQKNIPIPFTRSKVAVSQGDTEAGGKRTTLYAIDSKIASDFQEIFKVTPLNVIALEANSKSILRLIDHFHSKDLFQKGTEQLHVVVDIGHSWASISVYTQKGSSLFSRAISYKHIAVTSEEKVLLPKVVADSIIEAIGEIMVYFEQHEQKITYIFLSGVEALDEKLNKELSKISTKEVPILNLGKAIKVGNLNEQKLHTFGAAVGAALRAVYPRRYAYQHNLLTK
jgi:Tfp pilus assembly PilM family ATPase